MTPDGWLILLSTLLAFATYLLWVGKRLARVRLLLGILAFISFLLAIALHAVGMSHEVGSSDRRWDAGTEPFKPVGDAVNSPDRRDRTFCVPPRELRHRVRFAEHGASPARPIVTVAPRRTAPRAGGAQAHRAGFVRHPPCFTGERWTRT